MANFRKPSEIKADADKERDLIEQKSRPHLDKIEGLKTEKAGQINHYGAEIGKIRASQKMPLEEFAVWRTAVYELDEDDRPAEIERKVTELGL